MGDAETSDKESFETFGVHRLPLALGTKSGYVGVRPTKSKTRPWQAWVHIKDEKRRCLGSFKSPQEAAVARATAAANGIELLPSPRSQAPRNSGALAAGAHVPCPFCHIYHSSPHALTSRPCACVQQSDWQTWR